MVATPLASRVSRKLTREYAPWGSRNSLGNRFTSFPTSLHPFSFHLLLLLLFLSLSPFPFPHCAALANPPYAPSGSYLRVLLIFSYYRRGHVGMFTHTHIHICKFSSYLHGVRSTSKFTGLPPSYSAPFPMFLSSPPLPSLGASLRYSNMWAHYYRDARGAGGSRESRGISLAREQRRGETHTRPLGTRGKRASEWAFMQGC